MIRKYKVTVKHPKTIMNNNRVVVLTPGTLAYLVYDRQVASLIARKFIREVKELKKREIVKPEPKIEIKEIEDKPKKPKADKESEALVVKE